MLLSDLSVVSEPARRGLKEIMKKKSRARGGEEILARYKSTLEGATLSAP
jgi:hypothetical protein